MLALHTGGPRDIFCRMCYRRYYIYMDGDMKILMVGSNPSCSSPDNSSFHQRTKSRVIVDRWMDKIGAQNAQISFINVSDQKKANNRALSEKEIRDCLIDLGDRISAYPDYKIIALGRTSAKALKLLGINFFEAPHPSGLNRKLNDVTYVEDTLTGMKTWIMQQQA